MIRILCLLLLAVVLIMPSAIAHPREKARLLYKEGLALKRSGKLTAALKYFHAAIRKDDGFAPAYLELGQIYALLENYRQSIYYYRKLINEDNLSSAGPEDLQVIYHLGHVYYYEGNYKASAALWSRLLDLQPQNGFAMFMLGKSYIAAGEQTKGEELCDKATSSPVP